MIDTKLLRQKILDLAIRGKLVPQNPDDEPASVLLEKIRQEKSALVKAGKIKKDKHESFIFRGEDKHYYEQIDGKPTDITEEISFDIPENWTWCRLRNLGEIVGGGTPSTNNTKYWDNGDVAWLSPADLTGYTQKYISHGKKNITQSGLLNSSAKLMPTGSVLYSSRAPIGYVVISSGEISTNQGFKSIVPAITECNEFLYYYLKAATPEIKSRATGTTFKEISGNEFGATLVPFPPIAEQKRIVLQIEALFAEVDKIDKDSADLESALSLAKQKVLDLAIRGKLVPQNPADEPASELLKRIKAEKEALIKTGKIKKDKHESYIFRGDDNRYYEDDGKKRTEITDKIPFEIPDKWTWCKLNTIGQTNIGLTYKPSDICNNGTPVLRSNNIQNGKLDYSEIVKVSCDLADNVILRDSDLLICARNGSKALVGKSAIFNASGDRISFGAFMAVFRSKYNNWIYHILYSKYFRDYLFDANSTQICQLTQDMLKNFMIPFPPIAEQKRIVSQIEKIFSMLETMQK